MRRHQLIQVLMLVVTLALIVPEIFQHATAQSRAVVKPVARTILKSAGPPAPVMRVEKNPKFINRWPQGGIPKLRNPRPLLRKDRIAAIRAIRLAAGIRTRDLPQTPPAMITLTPDSPRSGNSTYSMITGNSIIGIGYSVNMIKEGNDKGLFFKFRGLIPNKTYLLDLSVSTLSKWHLEGAYNGDVQAQPDHILVGFIANESTAAVAATFLREGNNNSGSFTRAELTPVN